MQFESFHSLARLTGPVWVTEKLDGTNACIYIEHRDLVDQEILDSGSVPFMSCHDYVIVAGSRTRWLSAKSDNCGFGRWVSANRDALVRLGPGRHSGEWWGQGIQRGYGLKEKRFSLFNTGRWNAETLEGIPVSAVPLLWIGAFDTEMFEHIMLSLKMDGSHAVPGYMNPEGIVIYDSRSGSTFKKTFDYDDTGKGKQKDEHGNTI